MEDFFFLIIRTRRFVVRSTRLLVGIASTWAPALGWERKLSKVFREDKVTEPGVTRESDQEATRRPGQEIA